MDSSFIGIERSIRVIKNYITIFEICHEQENSYPSLIGKEFVDALNCLVREFTEEPTDETDGYGYGCSNKSCFYRTRINAIDDFAREVKILVEQWKNFCPFGIGDIDKIVDELKEV